MKVTLIYAGISGSGFNTAGKGMDSGWISHGLILLGACAQQVGFTVDLVDLRALRDWDHFCSEILVRRPDVAALTMMSVDYNPVMRCLDIIKDILPHTVTVVGGPHPTLALHEIANNPKIDHIVTHEGEIVFVELLQKLAAGERTERIIRGKKPDLDTLPFGDRNLFLNEWRKAGYTLESPEVPLGDLPAPFVTIIAGRGCIYNCSFCQPAERILFDGRVRHRSVNNVIAELRYLRERYNFRSLLIHDDCLTEDRSWVMEFCHAYQENGFRQPFFCQSRADIIVKHEDMVGLMHQAGLTGFFIGFESGNDRILRFIRKGTTVAQNMEAARICKRYSIQIWANYMLGLPTETKAEIMDTVRMLKKIDPDYYSPAFYTPHPGSDLYTYCLENDLSLIVDHDSYRRNPTEAKIKGHDYQFLLWALTESQRRTPINAVKRTIKATLRRYASPRKVVRKLRGMAIRIAASLVPASGRG
ncbi:MAG: cobalamin-dependent protein [Chloroflexi bacterium]|nr:cobalamin-dependent protein [Chloroflexota bacterium]MCL5074120.1 cobalamin-dependent protein [Chloroflexota bacterium]